MVVELAQFLVQFLLPLAQLRNPCLLLSSFSKARNFSSVSLPEKLPPNFQIFPSALAEDPLSVSSLASYPPLSTLSTGCPLSQTPEAAFFSLIPLPQILTPLGFSPGVFFSLFGPLLPSPRRRPFLSGFPLFDLPRSFKP